MSVAGEITDRDTSVWKDVIYDPDNIHIQDISSGWSDYTNKLNENLAGFFYTDIRRVRHLFSSPFSFKKELRKLSQEEKLFWNDYASGIPGKLKLLHLFIRRYNDFCRTCLIPYDDLEKLAKADHIRYCSKYNSLLQNREVVRDSDFIPVPFHDLPEEERRFYIEMNHLIPVGLKRIGYEIIRLEELAEIDEKLVRRLARTIHSTYLKEKRKQDQATKKDTYISLVYNAENVKNPNMVDFDDLPEEIKHSNLDNAFHIPTKLLSIGYKIRPVGKGFKPVALHLSEAEVETMARVEHIRWCWDKILHGWFYGKVRDNRKKIHPSIIPYEDLSEPEKEKDRELIRLIPALLQDIDHEAFPINPDRIRRLPYAIKPQSTIHRILDQTRQMNTQIRKLVTLSPEVEEMVNARNKTIGDAIREIEASYKYAHHIQETFLPDNLYVRECIPESFVLFKPKDIVSGDFYFFSKKEHHIIFAAADCTGHGIPGALLTTIGYGILDQAVNELKMTDPPEILFHLYSRLHRFLRFESDRTDVNDDMDIALCTLDAENMILTYSGVGNPIYHISGGELVEYRTGNSAEDINNEGRCTFSSKRLHLKNGDTIYLFSDGYADQFGGRDHKKYLGGRLKSFLLSIQGCSMTEQSDRLYEEIEKWREANNEEQTDDILVIGIRI